MVGTGLGGSSGTLNKAMPMGPKRAHTTRTIPIVTWRRVTRMGFIVLCRKRKHVHSESRQPLDWQM